jgi:thioredoxin 1
VKREATAAVPLVALLATLLVAACGGGGARPTSSTPPAPGPASRVVILGAANFEALVLGSARPALVEFHLPTCPACLAMAPVVERLAADFEGRALVGTVEAGREGALVSAHRISAVPTFVFFRSGQEVSRQVGATTYEDLAGQLQALVSSS